MKGEIVFHLGLHKTATTAFQQHLLPNLKGANYLGRMFPADPLRTIDRVIDAITCVDPLYFDSAHVRNMLDSCCHEGKLNIVSHELLSGPLWAGFGQRGLDHRSAIIQNLVACRPDARIVLVLRRQDHWARSVYRQYVVAGGVEKPASLFEGAKPLFSTHRFLYTPYVQALQRAFRGGVQILFYEQLLQDRRSFYATLEGFLDVRIEDLPLPESNSSRVGPVGMALSRQLNRYFRGRLNSSAPLPMIPRRSGGRWRRESAVALLHKLWSKFSVSANRERSSIAISEEDARVFAAIRARCLPDNRKLGKLLNIDLAPYGYYE